MAARADRCILCDKNDIKCWRHASYGLVSCMALSLKLPVVR